MTTHLLFLIDFALQHADPVALTNKSSTLEILTHPVMMKVLTAIVACLLGLVVALVAGILTKRSQALSVAIAASGGAFAATVLLCLALFSYILS